MDTLPREILFGEIAPRVGSAGRRMLALTCRGYLAGLPKLCPRKIVVADRARYKVLAARPTLTPADIQECGASLQDVFLAVARIGCYPKEYFGAYNLEKINKSFGYISDDIIVSAIMIAHRRGHTTIIRWLWGCRGCTVGFPLLAISRGNYHLLSLMADKNISRYAAADKKYLERPGVFDYLLANPRMFSDRSLTDHVVGGITRERYRRIADTPGVDLWLLKCSANAYINWFILFENARSDTTLTEYALFGGYHVMRQHYPELASRVRRFAWAHGCRYFGHGTKDMWDAMFQDVLAELGFTEAIRPFVESDDRERPWIDEYVSGVDNPGSFILPNVPWNARCGHLLKLGVTPNPSSEDQLRRRAELEDIWRGELSTSELARRLRMCDDPELASMYESEVHHRLADGFEVDLQDIGEIAHASLATLRLGLLFNGAVVRHLRWNMSR